MGNEMTNELLQQVAQDVAKLLVAVMGNGTKGLSQRINEVEDWVREHPKTCPLGEHIASTVDTLKERKTSLWAIFAAIFGAIGVVGSLVVAVFK